MGRKLKRNLLVLRAARDQSGVKTKRKRKASYRGVLLTLKLPLVCFSKGSSKVEKRERERAETKEASFVVIGGRP